jgi:hypothetical protein
MEFLLDHFVRSAAQRGWNSDAECLGMALFAICATFAPAIGPTIGGYRTRLTIENHQTDSISDFFQVLNFWRRFINFLMGRWMIPWEARQHRRRPWRGGRVRLRLGASPACCRRGMHKSPRPTRLNARIMRERLHSAALP